MREIVPIEILKIKMRDCKEELQQRNYCLHLNDFPCHKSPHADIFVLEVHQRRIHQESTAGCYTKISQTSILNEKYNKSTSILNEKYHSV